MAQWQSGDVTANGIKIHYTRTGGGKTPLVLNHGATDNGLCWTPVARALEAEYDVIMGTGARPRRRRGTARASGPPTWPA
jgi:N-formylmaleamate deformylase